MKNPAARSGRDRSRLRLLGGRLNTRGRWGLSLSRIDRAPLFRRRSFDDTRLLINNRKKALRTRLLTRLRNVLLEAYTLIIDPVGQTSVNEGQRFVGSKRNKVTLTGAKLVAVSARIGRVIVFQHSDLDRLGSDVRKAVTPSERRRSFRLVGTACRSHVLSPRVCWVGIVAIRACLLDGVYILTPFFDRRALSRGLGRVGPASIPDGREFPLATWAIDWGKPGA